MWREKLDIFCGHSHRGPDPTSIIRLYNVLQICQKKCQAKKCRQNARKNRLPLYEKLSGYVKKKRLCIRTRQINGEIFSQCSGFQPGAEKLYF
jgi:hypothetical protein